MVRPKYSGHMATRVTRRRTTEEVRRLILDAAGELFAANGYDDTRSKDIADRAGVQERLLFTNFESKAGLFHAAMVEPLREVVAEYVSAWTDQASASEPADRIARFVTGLYDFALRNKAALRSVLSGPESNGRSPAHHLADLIATALQASLDLEAIKNYDLDGQALLIDVAGMAFGVALLDDLLIPQGTRRPSRSRLLNEMIAICVHAALDRPAKTTANRSAKVKD